MEILIATTLSPDQEIKDFEEDLCDDDLKYFCPYCHALINDGEEAELLIHDYSSIPMHWGYGCCNSKALILESTVKKMNLKEAKEAFPRYADSLDQLPETYKLFLSARCAFVKRISSSQLYMYKLDQNSAITDEDVYYFIEGDGERYVFSFDPEEQQMANKKWNEEVYPGMLAKRTDLIQRLGITKIENNYNQVENDDVENDDEDKIDWRLSLPVNSYDPEHPNERNPYPKNFDIAHDGVYVHVLCEDENGNDLHAYYWGD
jgi:hypothetical protein